MYIFLLGAFFCLSFSWVGLILSSQIQYGSLKPIAMEEGELAYPQKIPGMAAQGKQVYIEFGCVYCHTQQTRKKDFGADYERGWGDRQSVARDYILQERVLLGTMRTGPDLMTIGSRNSIPDWHYLHLFDPQITSPGSSMPPYAFFFKTQKIKRKPSPNALRFPPTYANKPELGYEIVPTQRAEALVAYLLSLKLDYELPESKFSND